MSVIYIPWPANMTGRNDQRKEDAKIIADRDATITTMHTNLAKHLMSENPDLSNEEALSMAGKILG